MKKIINYLERIKEKSTEELEILNQNKSVIDPLLAQIIEKVLALRASAPEQDVNTLNYNIIVEELAPKPTTPPIQIKPAKPTLSNGLGNLLVPSINKYFAFYIYAFALFGYQISVDILQSLVGRTLSSAVYDSAVNFSYNITVCLIIIAFILLAFQGCKRYRYLILSLTIPYITMIICAISNQRISPILNITYFISTFLTPIILAVFGKSKFFKLAALGLILTFIIQRMCLVSETAKEILYSSTIEVRTETSNGYSTITYYIQSVWGYLLDYILTFINIISFALIAVGLYKADQKEKQIQSNEI